MEKWKKAILNFIKVLYYIQIQLNGAVEKGNHRIIDKSTNGWTRIFTLNFIKVFYKFIRMQESNHLC